MKKFLSNVAKVGTGIVLGSCMTALASMQLAQNVYLNDEIKISVNGQVQTLRDATTGAIEYPLTYRSRTYIPLRSVATLLGFDVDYVTETNTATVDSPSYVKPAEPQTNQSLKLEGLSSSNIPIINALNWQNPPLKESSSLLKNTYVVSNVVNSLYSVLDLGYNPDSVHPESPLKDELSKLISDAVEQRNKMGSRASLSIHCSPSSVQYLKYGYDSNGKCKGCVASYELELTYSYNGQTQTEKQALKSIFIFKDTSNVQLTWVGDIIE